jgi:5-carboxymethyl-2-hydroxymuconate isomerase
MPHAASLGLHASLTIMSGRRQPTKKRAHAKIFHVIGQVLTAKLLLFASGCPPS